MSRVSDQVVPTAFCKELSPDSLSIQFTLALLDLLQIGSELAGHRSQASWLRVPSLALMMTVEPNEFT